VSWFHEHEAEVVAASVIAIIVAAILVFAGVQMNCESKTCPPGTKPFMAKYFTCICAAEPK
jgi:hypothetical protein